MQGPILPHTAVALNRLAASHAAQFSASMQTLEETVCFSLFSLPPASVRSRKPRRSSVVDPYQFLSDADPRIHDSESRIRIREAIKLRIRLDSDPTWTFCGRWKKM
jgi:hypothetical protein